MKRYLNLGFYVVAILVPVYLVVRVYNPAQHSLQNMDDTNITAVDVLARATSALDKQGKLGPILDCSDNNWVESCLLPAGIIETVPEGAQNVNMESSGEDYIIFTKLVSLADTQKCFEPEQTYYVYYSKEDRKGFACSDGVPEIGNLYFIP